MEDEESFDNFSAVALELTKIIAAEDTNGSATRKKDPKAYYLKLYADCYATVYSGEAPEEPAEKE